MVSCGCFDWKRRCSLRSSPLALALDARSTNAFTITKFCGTLLPRRNLCPSHRGELFVWWVQRVWNHCWSYNPLMPSPLASDTCSANSSSSVTLIPLSIRRNFQSYSITTKNCQACGWKQKTVAPLITLMHCQDYRRKRYELLPSDYDGWKTNEKTNERLKTKWLKTKTLKSIK